MVDLMKYHVLTPERIVDRQADLDLKGIRTAKATAS